MTARGSQTLTGWDPAEPGTEHTAVQVWYTRPFVDSLKERIRHLEMLICQSYLAESKLAAEVRRHRGRARSFGLALGWLVCGYAGLVALAIAVMARGLEGGRAVIAWSWFAVWLLVAVGIMVGKACMRDGAVSVVVGLVALCGAVVLAVMVAALAVIALPYHAALRVWRWCARRVHALPQRRCLPSWFALNG